MITLSALGDEIDPDLDVQMDWVGNWGLRFIDVRAIDGVGIAKMTVSQARQYRQRLTDRGLAVPCVCSPIGKTPLEDAFAGQLELLRCCFDVARAFETNQVRIFSFYPSPDRSIAEQRGEVIERLRAMVDLAADGDMVLLHENVRGVYGAKPAGVKDIFQSIRSEHLRGIFDPGNYVAESVAAPFDEGWQQGLAETSTWIHVKDKRLGEEGYVTAGAGDGQFPQLLADVKARDWSGVVAVEPHLAKGVSGPKLFGEAVAAIKSLLAQAELAYR